MLFGEIKRENASHILVTVASDRGDAKEFGLVGDFKLDKRTCIVVNRRDLRAARPRLLDEIEVPATVLEELARISPSSVD